MGGIARKSWSAGRIVPLAVLLAGFALFFIFDLDRYLSFQAIRDNREWLLARVEANGMLAALAFVVVYALVVAFSIPGGAVLTIVSGFMFGTVLGGISTVFGATIGACALFLAARTAFADVLRAKAGPALRRMERGFRSDAFNYLLVLRLVPIFPFWLVNLVPAFLGVPLPTYVIATFIGILPGTLVFASLGNGLGAILDDGGTPDISIIFKAEILFPIIALAILALVPVAYKRLKERRAKVE